MTEGTIKVRVATAGVIVATFLLGAAAGAGGYRLMKPHHRPPPMLPLNELNLTPDQDQKAHAIIEKRRPELEAIMHESFPKVRAIHEDIERDVRKLLDPAQIKHLDEIEARRPPHGHGHGDGMFGGPPGGPPPGGPMGGPPPGGTMGPPPGGTMGPPPGGPPPAP